MFLLYIAGLLLWKSYFTQGDCRAPLLPSNIEISLIKSNYAQKEIVSLNCLDEKSLLYGTPNLICLANGKWNAYCEPRKNCFRNPQTTCLTNSPVEVAYARTPSGPIQHSNLFQGLESPGVTLKKIENDEATLDIFFENDIPLLAIRVVYPIGQQLAATSSNALTDTGPCLFQEGPSFRLKRGSVTVTLLSYDYLCKSGNTYFAKLKLGLVPEIAIREIQFFSSLQKSDNPLVKNEADANPINKNSSINGTNINDSSDPKTQKVWSLNTYSMLAGITVGGVTTLIVVLMGYCMKRCSRRTVKEDQSMSNSINPTAELAMEERQRVIYRRGNPNNRADWIYQKQQNLYSVHDQPPPVNNSHVYADTVYPVAGSSLRRK